MKRRADLSFEKIQIKKIKIKKKMENKNCHMHLS